MTRVVHGMMRHFLWPWLTVLLLLVAPKVQGEEPPAAVGHQETSEPHLPSRLAPLGLEKLMEIEVSTVTRTPMTVGETPAAVFVITQEDIKRSGATTIPELFRRVPGMDVARIDNNKWAISARGFNDRFSNKLLVLRDGRTIYDALFAGVVWNSVDYPLEDIDRIEIIRGAGGSLWGANAVNGIINIVTKTAKETRGGLLSGGGGWPEGGFGELRYGGAIGDKTSYRVYGKGFRRDNQFSQVGDPNDQWWGASTGMRVDSQLSERNSLTLQSDYVHSDAGRRDALPQLSPPSSSLVNGAFVSDGTSFLSRWTHQTGERSNWSIQGYWWRFESHQNNAGLHNSYDTFDLDFEHQFPLLDRHKVIYGLGYRYQTGRAGNSNLNGFYTSWVPNNRDLSLYSAFLQDEFALVPDELTAVLGLKFLHNDFTGFETQPTARLLWTPTGKQTAWLAVSRAVRTPSILEESIQVTNPPTTLPAGAAVFPRATGNPDLRSETMIAYEAGYRAQPAHSFSVDLALFYNDYDRLIVSVPQTPTAGPVAGTLILPVLFQNRMKGKTYGAELAVDDRLASWWRLYGAYTFLKMDLTADPSLPPATRLSIEKGAEGRNPQHQLYLQSSWDLPGRIELDLIGRYVSSLPGFFQKIAGYTAMDVRVAYRPRQNLEVSVVGQNLFHDHHPEFGTASILATPTVEIRRNVYAKVTWSF